MEVGALITSGYVRDQNHEYQPARFRVMRRISFEDYASFVRREYPESASKIHYAPDAFYYEVLID